MDGEERYAPQVTIPVGGTRIYSDTAGRPFYTQTDISPTHASQTVESDAAHRDKAPFVTIASPVNTPSGVAVISDWHGRSVADSIVNTNVIYGDSEYPVVYGARTWKGTRVDNPIVEECRSSPYGYRVHGLMDRVGIGIIEENSKIMRAHGLPTERIAAVTQINEIYYEEKLVSVEEWKRITLEQAKGRPDFAKIEAYLRDTNFYIVERDLQLAERLSDLKGLSEKDFHSIMGKAFKWVNAVFATKKSGVIPNTQAPPPFEATPEDERRYFSDWLPTQMGIYLARFHNANLIHGYAHSQNWSIAGTLYDLDSVYVETDEAARQRGQSVDITKTCSVIKSLLVGGNTLTQDDRYKALRNFSIHYINERGLGKGNSVDYKAAYKSYIDPYVSDDELDMIWTEPEK